MLLLILCFSEFNPQLVVESRKKQYLDAVDNISWVAESDTVELTFHQDNEVRKYRINMEIEDRGEKEVKSFIYDSENLWKIEMKKEEKERVKFFSLPNLWGCNWYTIIPYDFNWEWESKEVATIKWEDGGVSYRLLMNSEGRMKRVWIDAPSGEVVINYRDWMDLDGFPDFPRGWEVTDVTGTREFTISSVHVNENFCTPCTFKLPSF